MFLGPLRNWPIGAEVWYEAESRYTPPPRVPVKGAVWNWFDAEL